MPQNVPRNRPITKSYWLSLFHWLKRSKKKKKSKSTVADVIGQDVPRQCLQFFPQITGIQDTNAFTSLVNKFTSSFVRLLTCFSEQYLFFFLNETSFSFHCNLRACIFFSLSFCGKSHWTQCRQNITTSLTCTLPKHGFATQEAGSGPTLRPALLGPQHNRWKMDNVLVIVCVCVSQGTAAARTRRAIV